MAPSRLLLRAAYARASRTGGQRVRAFSSTSQCLADEPKPVPLSSRCNDTAEKYRQYMINKPLNPHLTNTTSTIANEFPSLGQDKPPADMLTNVDPNYTPKDSVPENTERMTGGTQPGAPGKGPNAELDVGEIQGGTFKVEPHRRSGESEDTLRARLLCPSHLHRHALSFPPSIASINLSIRCLDSSHCITHAFVDLELINACRSESQTGNSRE